MFKLDPNPTFEARVSGFVPGRPGDCLVVTFRHQTAEQFAAWHASFADKTVEELLLDVIHSWRDAPREFSVDALRETNNRYPAFVPALLDTYRRELFEARTKN